MKRLGWMLLALGVQRIRATAADLREAPADEVGMSAERLDRITAMAQGYVDEGKLAGVVTLVARDGAIVHFEAVGNRGANDDRPLEKDALFRIFSMTKPITAVAAMILYEEGKFQLSDPVSKFVPEFENLTVLGDDGVIRPAENEMTMQQLLSHTTGLSYGFNPADAVDQRYQAAELWSSKDLDELTEKIAAIPLKFEPGAQWHYSVAVDITGVVVERISGQTFDVFLKERIFDPARHGGHLLQRAGGQARPLPAEPHMGCRERDAGADGQ